MNNIIITVWVQRQVKDPVGVALQLPQFLHRRVLPQTELVLRKAVRTQDFLLVRVPQNGTELAIRVNVLQELPLLSVPYLHRSILSPSTSGKNILLMRGPTQCFHCSCVVVGEGLDRSVVGLFPNVEVVIVST